MYLPNARLTFGSGRSSYNQNIHLSVNQLTVCGKRCGENYEDTELAYVTCPQCFKWMCWETSAFMAQVDGKLVYPKKVKGTNGEFIVWRKLR